MTKGKALLGNRKYVTKGSVQGVLLLIIAMLFLAGCSKKKENPPVAIVTETSVATIESEKTEVEKTAEKTVSEITKETNRQQPSIEELSKGLNYNEWLETDYVKEYLRGTDDYGMFLLWDSEEGYGQIISNGKKIHKEKNQKLVFYNCLGKYEIKEVLTVETASVSSIFMGTDLEISVIDSDKKFDVVLLIKDMDTTRMRQFEMTIVP